MILFDSKAIRIVGCHAEGEVGDRPITRSAIDSRFDGHIVAGTRVGDRPATVPEIGGRAWITGCTELMLDPADPWARGYRVADTWPKPPRI